jgi:MFS family permease
MTRQAGALQTRTVALCVAINMLDGFDVLAAAFVAPALAADWGMRPAALGMIFSAGPVGMALGSLLLSPLADRCGRKTILIISMTIMGIGMLAAAFAPTVPILALMRVLTGFGIGGALSSANTLTAEFSAPGRRSFNISLYSAGYPIGATLGGLAAAGLVAAFDWRAVFLFGAALSVVMVPALLLWMPESLTRTSARNPVADGRSPDVGPPDGGKGAQSRPAEGGWSRRVVLDTVLLCVSYMFVMQAVYFVLQWTPKVLVDSGLSLQAGISSGTLMNLGGVFGTLLFGAIALRRSTPGTAAWTCVVFFGLMMAFTFAPARLEIVLPLAFGVGVTVFAAMTGLYAMAPIVFPAAIRVTGTGLALGVGRIGAIAGPFVTGLLIEAGWSRWGYFVAMSAPMLISALCLWRIRAERS